MLLRWCHSRMTGPWQVSGQQRDSSSLCSSSLSLAPVLSWHNVTICGRAAVETHSDTRGRRTPRSADLRQKNTLLYSKPYATCHDKSWGLHVPAFCFMLWNSLLRIEELRNLLSFVTALRLKGLFEEPRNSCFRKCILFKAWLIKLTGCRSHRTLLFHCFF